MVRLIWVVLAGLIISCSPRSSVVKSLRETENIFKDHTGFALYDPVKKKNLIEFNAEKYFTPASNTKIFTFYTALNLLGDSVASLKYELQNDSLIFWGMGDPSFLYGNVYQNQKIINFLKQRPEKLFFASTNFQTEALGEGWAWDDYPYYYSAERSSLPVYGNLIDLKKSSSSTLSITPKYFSSSLTNSQHVHEEEEIIRGRDSNQLTYYKGKKTKNEWTVPFHATDEVVANLLSDTLKRPVFLIQKSMTGNATILKSLPIDSLLKVMMVESDNFIAEQLLLQCAAILSDTLKPEIAIEYSKKNILADLPDKIQWVDGSGLSRFNLFTPRSIVKLWNKIYLTIPRERLFKLLAVGGNSGTIKNWYKAEVPYIYGKTGSLSNNHCLSGFILTKSGKTLIFSMMSNNFVASSVELKRQIEKILKSVYEKY